MLRFSKVRVCVRPVAVLSGGHVGGGGAIQETSVPRVCATVPHPPLLHPPTSPPLSLRHVCQGSHWSPRRVENSPRSAQDIRSSLYTDTYVCTVPLNEGSSLPYNHTSSPLNKRHLCVPCSELTLYYIKAMGTMLYSETHFRAHLHIF